MRISTLVALATMFLHGANGYARSQFYPWVVDPTMVNDTGLSYKAGQVVILTATGVASLGIVPAERMFFSGPDGNPNYSDPSYITRRCTFMSLIGKFGTTGNWHCIGKGTTLTAETAGDLFLAVNDGNLTDNYGALVALVKQ